MGDLNGDGELDLVTANDGDRSYVNVFLNTGGSFVPKVQLPTAPNTGSIAVGDVTGDGKLDIVAGDDIVSVLANIGNGTFAAPAAYAQTMSPNSFSIFDMNGDGKLDFVATVGSADLEVLFNQGDGTFTPPSAYATGITPGAQAAGDLDGDGTVDLVAADYNSPTLSVQLNNGDDTFAAPATYLIDAFNCTAALAAIGHRRPHLQASVREMLSAERRAASKPDSAPRPEWVEQAVSTALATFDDPDAAVRAHTQWGRGLAFEQSNGFPQSSPWRFERAEDIPDALAACVAANAHADYFTEPSGRDHLIQATAWLARVGPEDLFLPAGWREHTWQRGTRSIRGPGQTGPRPALRLRSCRVQRTPFLVHRSWTVPLVGSRLSAPCHARGHRSRLPLQTEKFPWG